MSDFTMTRGDTLEFDIAVTVASSGAPQDITGCSLWFTLKRNQGDADPGYLQKTIGAGITVISLSGGTARAKLVPADTSAITSQAAFYYDCQLKDGTGNIYTLDSGTITVKLDSTRAIV